MTVASACASDRRAELLVKASDPLVSIVILTWNSRAYLEGCLCSLAAGGVTVPSEVIVVDNASTDGAADLIADRFPSVRYQRNSRNLGVARARNRGLLRARGRYAMLLDVDTVVAAGAVDRLVAYLEEHPRVGMVGPRLESPAGELQLTARRFHNGLTPIVRRLDHLERFRNGRELRRFLMSDVRHDAPMRVDHVIGAAQLIRREALRRAGLLDERMFYGFEDTEICVRMYRLGYQVHYLPTSIVVHHEQRMTRTLRAQLRSMWLFFTRYPRGLWGDYV
ncbi:MAG: glycosyltransferase family 2 protein [Candidatus Schekmanbacteria bacterium]|nr:glycosyltransferase family 2 protein [Candidatus Schekmanbacteria bacterium]